MRKFTKAEFKRFLCEGGWSRTENISDGGTGMHDVTVKDLSSDESEDITISYETHSVVGEKISEKQGVVVTTRECMDWEQYDDLSFGQCQLHPDIEVIEIDGVELTDNEYDSVAEYALIQEALPEAFFGADYSEIEKEISSHDIDLVDEESDLPTISIKNLHGPTIMFSGEKLAEARWSIDNNRWRTFCLYSAPCGKFVAVRQFESHLANEEDFEEAVVCDSLAAVKAVFGEGDLAEEIYYILRMQEKFL